MTEDPKKRTNKAPAATVLALLAALGIAEGSKHYAYRDQAGVLTVCAGITGKDVIAGKWYSSEECRVLETRFIERMNATIGKCIFPMGLNRDEWVAWGHFTYNTGTPAFCRSTAARLLREGKYEQACHQMARWTFITKPGRGAVNCRIKAEKCGGIPKRRDLEEKMCMDAQS